MVADAAEMARQVASRHPGTRLVLLGESMGGAVLMCLARSGLGPPGARYVLVAPAVWGRATMNIFLRSGLWLVSTVLPGMAVSGAPVRVMASDNRDALIRLSRDPLTIHDTRFDALRGLVDLMDAALAAAAGFSAQGLFLYGGRDELVPKGAMAAMWRTLPRGGAREAFYPDAYHLLLRDLGRAAALADIVAWVRDSAAPLPSGADRAAAAWLSAQA
jgi:alpha-beta hydrolase superfamily lysophospholipase